MGNVLGSNLFNLLAALGCTAIVAPLVIKKHIIKNDFIVNLIATFILYVFTFTGLIGSKNSLSRIDGAVLVLMCITYIIYLIYTVKRNNKKEDEVVSPYTKKAKKYSNWVYIVISAFIFLLVVLAILWSVKQVTINKQVTDIISYGK